MFLNVKFVWHVVFAFVRECAFFGCENNNRLKSHQKWAFRANFEKRKQKLQI